MNYELVSLVYGSSEVQEFGSSADTMGCFHWELTNSKTQELKNLNTPYNLKTLKPYNRKKGS